MVAVNHNGGNGGENVTTKLEIERRDLLKLAALVVAIVGLIVGPGFAFLGKYFQSRTQAVIEHAALAQESALQKQESQLRYEFGKDKTTDVDNDIAKIGRGLEAVQKMSEALHANQQVMMNNDDIPRWQRKPLPAKVEFNFEGGDDRSDQ